VGTGSGPGSTIMGTMRAEPTILHVDLDAFYAAVEQRDKPSLRGKPVVVGGTGGRGVVATASYEARRYGVHSAMSTREARARCPHAAYLAGRHHVYRQVSGLVMGVLREVSPLVEPLSLDEAFLDLAAGDLAETSVTAVADVGYRLKARVHEVTEGLTASVGIATSKLVAKIASDLDKPDGLVVVAPGTEAELLGPMPVRTIPGVGPATAERLRRVGVQTVEQLRGLSERELVRLVGQAHGSSLHALARAEDDRPVVAEREAKSISHEDTFDVDLVDRRLLEGLLTRQAGKVGERLRKARLSGRTVTVKVRLHDFTTHSRSLTLPSPTDEAATLARVARSLLGEVDTRDGVRLLGVGVSGLADWIQEDLFDLDALAGSDRSDGQEMAAGPGSTGGSGGPDTETTSVPTPSPPGWAPGTDVEHDEHGPGWVWGSGVGRVTVRFETATTGPGPVRTFAADDPALRATQPSRDAAG
jgi:DNA polymerase IV